MDKIRVTGISLFSIGVLIILAFLFYKFFLEATEVPEIIRISLSLIFLGLVVLLISLTFERLKELRK